MLIRHLWKLKTVVFVHRCLICDVLLAWFMFHPGNISVVTRNQWLVLLSNFLLLLNLFKHASNKIVTISNLHLFFYPALAVVELLAIL